MLLVLTLPHSMSSAITNEHSGHPTPNAELEWALNLSAANVLIIGARATDVASVQARVADPVTVVADGHVHDLAGTCIIADAVCLTRDQQHALCTRLERAPAVRLITLSAGPLHPLVESGDFDETLYYRLNTITLDFTVDAKALV
jgi:hypothetical protein